MFEAEDFWFWSRCDNWLEYWGGPHVGGRDFFVFFLILINEIIQIVYQIVTRFARQMDITYLLSRPDHRGRTE